ncbi:unnamed protein product [Prunus armeniaca]
MPAADPEMDKSNLVGDASVSDLLKTNFLSSPSACAKLVDRIHQADYLKLIRCAPSSAQLSESEKKNVELTSMLSTKQTRLRVMKSELKSSLVAKDSELSSSATNLDSRKYDCFHLKCKNADISLSYDELLARFRVYRKSAKKSKLEATMDAYKLGYLDCTNRNAPFYATGDEDIETLCRNLLPLKSTRATEKAVVEEDGAEQDTADEIVTDRESGALESVDDLVDAEEVTDQRSPACVSE